MRQNTEKKKPRTFKELKFYVSKAIKLLEQGELTKWFQHCWDYFKDEKGEEKIRKGVNWMDPLIRQEMFISIDVMKRLF